MMSVAGTELNRLVLFLSVPEGNGEERAGGSGGGPAGGKAHVEDTDEPEAKKTCCINVIGLINLFNNNQC
jgi:hypothetical protein